jgi:hypothetical protein
VTRLQRRAGHPAGMPPLLHWVWWYLISETGFMRSHRYPHPRPVLSSAFAGYRFPPEVISA